MRRVFITAALFLFSYKLVAQNTEFSVFQFSTPQGFTKLLQGNTCVFTSMNSKANRYCMIVLFAAEKKLSNGKNDFFNLWETKVCKLIHPNSVVSPQKMEADGFWKKESGESTFFQNNFTSSVLMTSYSNDENYACIVYLYSDSSYINQLLDFSNSVKINIKNNNINFNTTVSDANNILIGEWVNKNTLLANYVNTNGLITGDASIFSNETYRFTKDGKYENFYATTKSQKTNTYLYRGRYTLQDNILQLFPEFYEHKINNQISTNSGNLNNMKISTHKIIYEFDSQKKLMTFKLLGEDNLESDKFYKK